MIKTTEIIDKKLFGRPTQEEVNIAMDHIITRYLFEEKKINWL